MRLSFDSCSFSVLKRVQVSVLVFVLSSGHVTPKLVSRWTTGRGRRRRIDIRLAVHAVSHLKIIFRMVIAETKASRIAI